MSDDQSFPLPANANEARLWIAELGTQLQKRGIAMRMPPDEPTSCCGRGCNGCVWEAYLSAAGYWCEQARTALQNI